MNACDYLPDDIESKVDELTNHIKVRDEYAEAIAKAERRAKVALKTSRGAAQEKNRHLQYRGGVSSPASLHRHEQCLDKPDRISEESIRESEETGGNHKLSVLHKHTQYGFLSQGYQ